MRVVRVGRGEVQAVRQQLAETRAARSTGAMGERCGKYDGTRGGSDDGGDVFFSKINIKNKNKKQ